MHWCVVQGGDAILYLCSLADHYSKQIKLTCAAFSIRELYDTLHQISIAQFASGSTNSWMDVDSLLSWCRGSALQLLWSVLLSCDAGQHAAESGDSNQAVTPGLLSRIFCVILVGCYLSDLVRWFLVICCVLANYTLLVLLAQCCCNALQIQMPHPARQNQRSQHAQQGQQAQQHTSPAQHARQALISQQAGGSQQARQRHVMQSEQQQAEPALSASMRQQGPEQRVDYMQQQAAIWNDSQRSRAATTVTTQPSATVGLPQTASGSNATHGAAIAADDNGSSKASVRHTQNSSRGSVAAGDVCSVCMDAQKDWACIPCGHLAMCKDCSARVKRLTGRCPICSQRIKQVMQVYRT